MARGYEDHIVRHNGGWLWTDKEPTVYDEGFANNANFLEVGHPGKVYEWTKTLWYKGKHVEILN